MSLLIISFISGILTVLAPCTLPVLPIIVGGSLQDSRAKWKPLIITGSLALSIVFFTLILKASTVFIDIPQSAWAYLSGTILVAFGLISLFPKPWEALSAKFKFSQKSNQLLADSANKKKGFWSDILVGASLGPVFSSCSPTYFVILATVLPQSFATGMLYLLAYAVGLAAVLLLVAFLGQKFTKKLQWAADPEGPFKRTLGVLFILVGLFVMTGLDKKVQTAVLESGYFNITNFEQKLLEQSEMNDDSITRAVDEAMGNTDKASRYNHYTEIVNPSGFVNTDSITLGELVGKKVILIDFMTYSCINCIRTFPFLVEWYEKYQDDGLEIIGIHTPEFAFEHDRNNVITAMNKYDITFPVVLDNDYATWRAYGNRYWPRKYLIDIDGYVVYDHIGEGAYTETEMKIQELLAERAEKLGMEKTITKSVTSGVTGHGERISPETYFGSRRNSNFGNGNRGISGIQSLTLPETLRTNVLYLDGEWDIQPEYARNTSAGERIIFPYQAKDVFIVADADQPIEVTILRDGEPISNEYAGEDVTDGKATINESRLYRLIEADNVGTHTFEMIISKPGLRAYAFTFG